MKSNVANGFTLTGCLCPQNIGEVSPFFSAGARGVRCTGW